MKPSDIGGMAVMEGVMMKHKDEYAVAVRKPNNEIVVEKSTYTDFSDKVKLFKLPVFRGMLAFVEGVVVGLKAFNFSTSFLEEEEDLKAKKKDIKKRNVNKKDKNENTLNDDDDFEIDDIIDESAVEAMIEAEIKREKPVVKKRDKSSAILTAVAILLSILLSVVLFMVLPVIITDFLAKLIPNQYTLEFIEGMLRFFIFIVYALLAAKMPEIKRVFMYHGAEHKTINCLEQGFELTLENVKGQSKRRKCCGTGFLLFVVIASLFVFILLPVDHVVMRFISRVVLVPLIAGVSYEFFLLARRSENKLVHTLSLPGLWMQGLTTKEPDDEMIEVAIQSVGAVIDWKPLVSASVDDKNDHNSKSLKAVNTYPKEKKRKNTKEKRITKDVEEIEDSVIKEVAAAKDTSNSNKNNRNHGIAPVPFKPIINDETEEEDDEILKALDKFFDGQSI